MNRYIECTQDLTSENRSEPFYAVQIYEAIRIGKFLETIDQSKHKIIFELFKRHDKRLETVLDFKDLNFVLSEIKVSPPKPYYHTKVEKIDRFGYVVETIYL